MPLYPTTFLADVFDDEKWAGELEGAIGVVSTIGAFGSNEFMEKICGDANIKAAETAKKAGKTSKQALYFFLLRKLSRVVLLVNFSFSSQA